MATDLSPLAGLRVVEMTEALAGPYCAMLLGDLGAEVIKVERPGSGDQSRAWGPPFVDGESAYYLAVNRNKRSLELDIKQEADLELLHALLARSDVFITNNPRMESLTRARLDPGTVHELNPRLVYAAISGYGHSGPKAGRAGYDVIAQGEAGLMAVTGGPADGPIRFPTPMADISAGIYTLIGVLAALYHRDCRGGSRGQLLDVSLVDSQVTWLANLGGSFFATGERPAKLGNVHPSITPYQPLRARDKELIVAVGTERLWQKLCATLGVEETLGSDARFASNRLRNQHRAELIAALEERLAERDAADWAERLVAAGVPAGPINFPDETLRDEHLAARGMIVELEHPLLGLVRSIGNPVHLTETPPSYRRHPPRLGEHNDEIRAELAAAAARSERDGEAPAAAVGDNRRVMAEPTRILVVEDNPVTSEVLQRRLTERGYLVLPAADGESALAAVAQQPPDLVLLDILLPTMDGLEVLRSLRRKYPASDLPVVVLTVKEGSDDVVEALRLGANDYVTKTVDFTVILARIETQLSLRRMTAKVRELAARDPLTGLFNRRGFYELAEKEESRARRYKTPLQALMIDLDSFKSLNDRYGHKIGDHVLVEAARRMRQALRASDILGRWGGEEFAALLPGVSKEGALHTAERLRALIESNPVETSAGAISYTVSVGVASFDGSCANLSDLLAHGDVALYAAKRAGRNRVVAHDPRRETPRPE